MQSRRPTPRCFRRVPRHGSRLVFHRIIKIFTFAARMSLLRRRFSRTIHAAYVPPEAQRCVTCANKTCVGPSGSG